MTKVVIVMIGTLVGLVVFILIVFTIAEMVSKRSLDPFIVLKSIMKEIKEENEKKRLLEILNKVKKMDDIYFDHFERIHGFRVAYDFRSGRMELPSNHDVDAYNTLREIILACESSPEKYSLVLDKYDETFRIVLDRLKDAKEMNLLDDSSLHTNIQEILQEPLRDINKIKEVALGSLNQGLRDELHILRGIREQNYGNMDIK